MAKLRLGVLIASGLIGAALYASAPAQAQPAPQPVTPAQVTPSVEVDPEAPGTTPHWTITLGAEYCGGYRVGDGVYVSPEPPLSPPTSVAEGSVLYSGQPAAVDWINGALRISPGPGLVQSMVCMAGQRPLKVELLPEAGFELPDAPGDYAVDVWTGANPTPMNLSFTLLPTDSAASSAQPL
jgi:hypothetical protein